MPGLRTVLASAIIARNGIELDDFPSSCDRGIHTKYDQFKREVRTRMKSEDHGGDPVEYEVEVENGFRQHYLARLGGSYV